MAGFENFNTHTSTTPQKPLFPTKESGILTKEKSEPISDKKSSQEKFNEELARKKALFDRIHKLETAEKSKEGDPRK